ncbi:hypothetical protein [Ascidiimonas aurantiaca]|uniref:hypothetical protein n=1 Tax=Ascidiimonas aurantiaca TaxID=1685432 RepID=UPI0030EEE269
MKKSLLILITLSIFAAKAYSQCNNIKTGTFISVDSLAGKTTIQRNHSIQLEENETLGIKFIEKLKWIDDCSYVIYEFNVLRNKGKISNPSGNFIVSLEQINDSVFKQTVLIEKLNFKHTSTTIKISDNISNEFKELLKKL